VGKFSGIACRVILCLVVDIFVQKNRIVKFCHLVLGGPVIMPHHVVVVVVDLLMSKYEIN